MAIQPVVQQQQQAQVAAISPAEKAAAPFRFTFVGRISKFDEKEGVLMLGLHHVEKSYGVEMPAHLQGDYMFKAASEVPIPDSLTIKSTVRVSGRIGLFMRLHEYADKSPNAPRGATKIGEFPDYVCVVEKIEVLPQAAPLKQ
jgi:hypothetical protein